MNRLHVLVVEDEPTNREVAEIVLLSEGHRVTLAENGAEALALCLDQGQRFDVVLMDMLMPVMDGLEATRQLRAHPETQSMPIIGVSAKASHASRERALRAGCDYYLAKPYRRKNLIQALKETLGETVAINSHPEII